MSTDTLRIGSMCARYHLRASETAHRPRLDRVLGEMLGDALTCAVERAGVPAHAEVCIRQIHAPVRLPLTLTDTTLAASWSDAIAQAIRDALAVARPDVVCYSSRSAALADLVAGAATGDLTRAWAWRQLGLADVHEGADRATIAAAAAEALLAEPRSIVPVLTALARANRLAALTRTILPATWRTLAVEACRESVGDDARISAAGVTSGFARAPAASATAPSVDEVEAAVDPVVLRLARRAVFDTAIGESLRAVSTAPAVRDALAVLALLEAEPTALHCAPQHALLMLRATARLADEVSARRGTADSGSRVVRRPSPARTDRDAWSSHGLAARVPEAPTSREEALTASDADAQRADMRVPRDTRAGVAAPIQEPDEAERVLETQQLGARDRHTLRVDDGLQVSAEGRRRGRTRWGGLLFLLNVLRDLELPAEIVDGEVGRQRGLRWTLHQLALALVPVADDDPAALAFCGLAPDAVPPSRGVAPQLAIERALVGNLAARVTEGLHAQLEQRELGRVALVHHVARRMATVEADPGWIDVALALDDVDVEVRRAGLDLDPGFVRWLGVVVRFVYG